MEVGAAFAVQLFGRVGVAGMVTLRLLAAAAALVIVARPGTRGYSRGDWAVVGAFAVALVSMNTLFYQAISRLPLGPAVTLEVLGPLTLSVVTGRRALNWLWAGLAVGGVFLLGHSGFDRLDPIGLLCIFGAAAMWAGYILLSARTGQRFAKADGLALAMTGAAVLSLPLGITHAGAAILDPAAAALGAATGVMSSAVPYSFELFALRRLATSTFAVLMSLGPALAAFVGLIMLNQQLAPTEWLAIGLVIMASMGAVRTAQGRAAGGDAAPVIG